MLETHITFDGQQITRRILSRVDKAKRGAIDTTLTWARKQLVDQLLQDNQEVPKIVFNKFRTIGGRTSQTKPHALLWGGGRDIKPKWLAQSRALMQRKGGAVAGKAFFPGGFVAKMKTGHDSIFKRVGKNRLPIKEQRYKIRNLDQRARALIPGIESEVLRRFEDRIARQS